MANTKVELNYYYRKEESFAWQYRKFGERVEIKDIFAVFQRNYWNAVIANIVVGIIVALGIFMLIVPGIIFACRLAFVPYLALQMKGAGYVLSAVTRGEIREWLGAAIVYGAVLLYVLKSGVLGVGWTNTFQGIFMMALAWGLGLYLPFRLYGGVEEMFMKIAAEKPDLLIAPGLTAEGAPWSWGEYCSWGCRPRPR